MLRTKRQRDQAACAFIATVPILLIVIVCTVIFVRRANPNNPENPDYISPQQRSRSSVASCEASRSSHFAGVQSPAMTTTNMFLPLLPTADYITVLGFGGKDNETTTWGVATHVPCTTNITVLPEPYLTYIAGPNTAAFNLTTSSFWYNYGGSASNFVVKTMSVDCQRSVRARYTYTRSVRVYSYGEPTASYTVETEVLSYLNFTATNTYSMTSGVYEESTASVMECTGRWNPDQGYALNYHTAIHTTDETCRYYEVCDDGRADVTIAGDLAGLTSRATTTNSSSTRTPAPSMVTKTMSQTSEVTTGTIPITTAPPPASTSATAAP